MKTNKHQNERIKCKIEVILYFKMEWSHLYNALITK